jgi:hypothetical protein
MNLKEQAGRAEKTKFALSNGIFGAWRVLKRCLILC